MNVNYYNIIYLSQSINFAYVKRKWKCQDLLCKLKTHVCTVMWLLCCWCTVREVVLLSCVYCSLFEKNDTVRRMMIRFIHSMFAVLGIVTCCGVKSYVHYCKRGGSMCENKGVIMQDWKCVISHLCFQATVFPLQNEAEPVYEKNCLAPWGLIRAFLL